MALTGNLEDFSITQLLSLVCLARKTGALTIQVPAGTTTLFFREGKLLGSVRNDILETTYALFSWTEGLFRFEPNQLPPEAAITVPIDLERIILEGNRRVKERERLEAELPDLNMALRFADDPGAQVRKTSLSVDEWRVIGYINPRNSLRQIAKRVGMDDLQIRRVVHRLLQAGLVELAESEGALGSRPPLPADAVIPQEPAVTGPLAQKPIDRDQGP